MKLNDDGVWELDERIVCSAGYTWGAQFSKYLSFGYMTPRNGGIYSIHPKNAGDSSRNDSNSIHTGYTYGRPASLGCIRVGSSSTNMWKKIVYLFRDKHEPIKLIYY